MKKCSKCLKLLNLSCFGIANSKTGQLRGDCKECRKIVSSNWYSLNKESRSISIKAWRQKNKEKMDSYQKEWVKSNRDKTKNYYRKYELNNQDKMSIKRTKRRVTENQAQPAWLTKVDLDCIKSIYNKAKEYTKLTGIKFHVDHIIPLRGKTVSGLHVPGNLRITTQQINLTKGNSF